MKNEIDIERKNIALLGSCIIRDPFTTFYNEDYKKYFDLKIAQERHSLISIMQEKKIVDESLLELSSDVSSNEFKFQCLKEDFNKSFLDLIKKDSIDYLILDVYFDVIWGIIKYNNNQIMTNDDSLKYTEYFKGMENIRKFNFSNNPKEFFDIWRHYCDEFFDFMEKNSPNTKIIVAEVRCASEVKRSDGTTYIDDYFKEKSEFNNPLFEKLERYIIENFDVYFLGIDKKNLLCEENHRWGKGFVHYTRDYYLDFFKKIKDIVAYDTLKKQYENMYYINKISEENRNKINSLESENTDLKKFKSDILNSKCYRLLNFLRKP